MTLRIESIRKQDSSLLMSVNIDKIELFEDIDIISKSDNFQQLIEDLRVDIAKVGSYLNSPELYQGKNLIGKLVDDISSKTREIVLWCEKVFQTVKIEDKLFNSQKSLFKIQKFLNQVKSGTDDLYAFSNYKKLIDSLYVYINECFEAQSLIKSKMDFLKNNPLEISVNFIANSESGYTFEIDVLNFTASGGEENYHILKSNRSILNKELNLQFSRVFEKSKEQQYQFKNQIKKTGNSIQEIIETLNFTEFLKFKSDIENTWYTVFESQTGLTHYIFQSSGFYSFCKNFIENRLKRLETEGYKVIKTYVDQFKVDPSELYLKYSVSDLLSKKFDNPKENSCVKNYSSLLDLKRRGFENTEVFFKNTCESLTKELGGEYFSDLNCRLITRNSKKVSLFRTKRYDLKSKDVEGVRRKFNLSKLKTTTNEFVSFSADISYGKEVLTLKDVIKIISLENKTI